MLAPSLRYDFAPSSQITRKDHAHAKVIRAKTDICVRTEKDKHMQNTVMKHLV